jgi:glycosyltransferase involved in cell wall biosynthesis
MHIVLIPHEFFPDSYGGVETVTYKLARYLRKRDCQVRILCHRYTNEKNSIISILDDTYEDLWVRRLIYNPNRRPTEARWGMIDKGIESHVSEILDKWQPDLIHPLGFSLTSAAAIKAASAENIPIVCSITNYEALCMRSNLIRSDGTLCCGPQSFRACWDCLRPTSAKNDLSYKLLQRLPRSILVALSQLNYFSPRSLGTLETVRLLDLRLNNLSVLFDQIDAFIVVSGWMKRILTINKIPEEKVVVSPHGIESIEADSRSLRPPIKFGFLGRLDRPKGAHIAIQAFCKLVRPEGASLEIYGSPVCGEKKYLQDLKRLARGCPRIHFNERLHHKDVLQKMRGIDVVIVPSIWHEPFGLVNIEALNTGTPVIASEIGGIPEIIEDGNNGYLFPPGDVAALRDKMQYCIDCPEALNQLASNIQPWRAFEEEARTFIRIYSRALNN